MFFGLFLYEVTPSEGDQGHVTHGWGKSIYPAKRELEWTLLLREILLEGTVGSEDGDVPHGVFSQSVEIRWQDNES